jgi:ribose transport system ATP-binding protein
LPPESSRIFCSALEALMPSRFMKRSTISFCFARWLCKNPKFLILDEPTRGIDIGAKGEIQSLINELAASGLGVLMISSELEELVEGSSRVVVMRDGRCVAELRGAEISQDNIIHAMAEGSATEVISDER